MEARAGNSILDFETLFSDSQELLNGSGLSRTLRLTGGKVDNQNKLSSAYQFARCAFKIKLD